MVSRRSTPAHAGNTGAGATRRDFDAVYPRPRGEYRQSASIREGVQGLPPPTRGIPQRVQPIQAAKGSTPAHAGNTALDRACLVVEQVYPRPRGEYLYRSVSISAIAGLPPPTRGIPRRLYRQLGGWRSTPAHAGNTLSDCLDKRNGEVYPRPRGEYPSAPALSTGRDGLPPPTRGIHPLSRRRQH